GGTVINRQLRIGKDVVQIQDIEVAVRVNPDHCIRKVLIFVLYPSDLLDVAASQGSSNGKENQQERRADCEFLPADPPFDKAIDHGTLYYHRKDVLSADEQDENGTDKRPNCKIQPPPGLQEHEERQQAQRVGKRVVESVDA